MRRGQIIAGGKMAALKKLAEGERKEEVSCGWGSGCVWFGKL